ncbi:hypothetical protein Clacol_001072 [Clathrus columnatus]|uniref:Transmembrane protein 135 N-terminal domain-containing protein n=1 Tax=Clathrus columnatus TaxID=1419009 RepID=A0AAV5A2T8_9AGAM|nr:hypothetical protein Clacol_001072 [Clathrus columnatus]
MDRKGHRRRDVVRRHAIRSFENLVALANDQERWQDARKMVWRDRGEPAVELATLKNCLEHALRGSIRAGALAFAIRSGFNLFLFLFRILRAPRPFKVMLLRRAILGQDSFRFGAMLGTFVFLYKYILNALPILLPPSTTDSSNNFDPSRWRNQFDGQKYAETIDEENDEFEVEETEEGETEAESDSLLVPTTGRLARLTPLRPLNTKPEEKGPILPTENVGRRLSIQAQAHQEWVRKRTKRWHAVFAGSIASLGLLFEKKGRRVAIAQQLFVRGLQGSYNEFSTKHNIKIPFGPVIVFSLACGPIMYAYLLRPETLSPGYNAWIQAASKTHRETILINKDLVREGHFNIGDMERILNHDTTHPTMRQRLNDELVRARTGDFGPRYASCAVVHPTVTSCTVQSIKAFIEVFGWSMPFYGALHLIPPLLFKRKSFMRDPKAKLLRALGGTIRSSTFLGTFVTIYYTYFCSKHRLHAYLTKNSTIQTGVPIPLLPFSNGKSPFITLPISLIDFLLSKQSFFLGGMLCGLALLVEARHRRPDFAMYVLPKALESAWRMARGRGMVKGPKVGGEVLNAYQPKTF